MTRYLDVPLADGSSFTVEVDDGKAGGPVTRSGRHADVVAQAGQTFEEALERVAPAFRALVGKLRDATEQPDAIEIEFGLKLSAEMGAIIARTGGEANFRIAVHWTRE